MPYWAPLAAIPSVAEAAHQELGEPGRLEKELVLGAPFLTRGAAHLAEVRNRMRGVEDDQAADQFGIQHRRQPGHCAAPIVAGDDAGRFTRLGDHACDVLGEIRQAIRRGVTRFR